MAGLDLNLQEYKQLCRMTWENEYDSLQKDRFGEKRRE